MYGEHEPREGDDDERPEHLPGDPVVEVEEVPPDAELELERLDPPGRHGLVVGVGDPGGEPDDDRPEPGEGDGEHRGPGDSELLASRERPQHPVAVGDDPVGGDHGRHDEDDIASQRQRHQRDDEPAVPPGAQQAQADDEDEQGEGLGV